MTTTAKKIKFFSLLGLILFMAHGANAPCALGALNITLPGQAGIPDVPANWTHAYGYLEHITSDWDGIVYPIALDTIPGSRYLGTWSWGFPTGSGAQICDQATALNENASLVWFGSIKCSNSGGTTESYVFVPQGGYAYHYVTVFGPLRVTKVEYETY